MTTCIVVNDAPSHKRVAARFAFQRSWKRVLATSAASWSQSSTGAGSLNVGPQWVPPPVSPISRVIAGAQGTPRNRREYHLKPEGEDFDQTAASQIVQPCRPCPTEDRKRGSQT